MSPRTPSRQWCYTDDTIVWEVAAETGVTVVA